MNIYDVLRFLIITARLPVQTPDNQARLAEFKASALDLIDKLEQTQALGTLTSETKGTLNVIMQNVR